MGCHAHDYVMFCKTPSCTRLALSIHGWPGISRLLWGRWPAWGSPHLARNCGQPLVADGGHRQETESLGPEVTWKYILPTVEGTWARSFPRSVCDEATATPTLNCRLVRAESREPSHAVPRLLTYRNCNRRVCCFKPPSL